MSDCIGTGCKAESLMVLVESQAAEIARLHDDLSYVERWANHHGQKPNTTPEEVLSMIQHYPPIKEITRGYRDGKLPETPDPWARLQAAWDGAFKQALENGQSALRAEAECDALRSALNSIHEIADEEYLGHRPSSTKLYEIRTYARAALAARAQETPK